MSVPAVEGVDLGSPLTPGYFMRCIEAIKTLYRDVYIDKCGKSEHPLYYDCSVQSALVRNAVSDTLSEVIEKIRVQHQLRIFANEQHAFRKKSAKIQRKSTLGCQDNINSPESIRENRMVVRRASQDKLESRKTWQFMTDEENAGSRRVLRSTIFKPDDKKGKS